MTGRLVDSVADELILDKLGTGRSVFDDLLAGGSFAGDPWSDV